MKTEDIHEDQGALDDDDDDNVDIVVSEIIGDVRVVADTTESDESTIVRKQEFKNLEEVLDPSNFDPLPPPENNRTYTYQTKAQRNRSLAMMKQDPLQRLRTK